MLAKALLSFSFAQAGLACAQTSFAATVLSHTVLDACTFTGLDVHVGVRASLVNIIMDLPVCQSVRQAFTNVSVTGMKVVVVHTATDVAKLAAGSVVRRRRVSMVAMVNVVKGAVM